MAKVGEGEEVKATDNLEMVWDRRGNELTTLTT